METLSKLDVPQSLNVLGVRYFFSSQTSWKGCFFFSSLLTGRGGGGDTISDTWFPPRGNQENGKEQEQVPGGLGAP